MIADYSIIALNNKLGKREVEWETVFYHLKHIFSLLGTRIIPFYLFSHDVQKTLQWQFNCCVQTSMILKSAVEDLFLEPGVNTANPFFPNDFIFKIYEGKFWDDLLPEKVYNHAFIFGYSDNLDLCFCLDVARVGSSNIISLSPRSPYSTPRKLDEMALQFISDHRHIWKVPYNCISVEEVNHVQAYSQEEYFTQKKLATLETDIYRIAKAYGIDFKNFDWTFSLKPQTTP